MHRPLRLKKIVGFWLFILLLFFSITWSARAAEPVKLLAMDKQENPGQTRIIFRLSGLPEFTMEHSGQRLDLLLKNARISTGLRNLPEDESVVKILLAQQHRDFMVSLLLRRPPAQVISESLNGPPRIVMDIVWNAADAASRPAVAFPIPGMPLRKAGPRAREYQFDSPWAGRWRAFFREYRPLWELQLPIVYSLPQLPPLIGEEESPLRSLQEHLDNRRFSRLLTEAAELTGLSAAQESLRDLLVAEAQLRSHAVAAGLARLQTPGRVNIQAQERVEYLTAWAQARSGQPIMAQVTVRQLLSGLPDVNPLRPAATLLLAETALASGQDRTARKALETLTDWPENLAASHRLRLTDARAGLQENAAVLEDYRELFKDADLAQRHRFSMNRAAFKAFRDAEYVLAADWYRQLVASRERESLPSLLPYAAGRAGYAAGDREWALIELERITLDAPGSEGGDRAELKLIDHRMLNGSELDRARAAREYARLGERSNVLAVREEACFKAALSLYLGDKLVRSVEQLMRFRREFASSALRRETDLLLLEQVPRVIEQQVADGAYLDAVVLAEQNRELLLRGGLSSAFLRSLSTAFERLGLDQRRARVLLYLFDRSAGQPEQKTLYLPLAESFHKRGAYAEAGRYAEEYLQRYPEGEDAPELYGLLLDALARQQRSDELQRWLERPERPQSLRLQTRIAWLYWQQGDFAAIVAELEPLYRSGAELHVKDLALLAEAAYQTGRDTLAENLYEGLFEDSGFAQQARYRAAQVALRREQRGTALKLLQEAVETDGDSSWGKLARDLLIQIRT